MSPFLKSGQNGTPPQAPEPGPERGPQSDVHPEDAEGIDVGSELTALDKLSAWMRKQPDLYDQGGTLARWDADANGGSGALITMTADSLAAYCKSRVLTVKTTKTSARTALLPSRLAKVLLLTEDSGLRPLDGVSRWPVVRPDGTIGGSGYDPETRLIVAADDVAEIPEEPSRGEVEEARAFLMDWLWAGFPYVSRADLSGVLAMYATPLLRSYLGGLAGGVPLTVITASTPGSGKSALGQIGMSALYGGIELDGGQTGRELQKSITAALHKDASPAILSVDNWKSGSAIAGEFWAKLITSPITEGRLIGTGTFVSARNARSVVISGNNVKVADDLGRRSVFIRLAPETSNPEETAHDFDYIAEVAEQRGKILHALLTLIRAWIVAGAPRGEAQLGNFTLWAQAVEGLCAFASLPSPLAERGATLESMDDTAADYGRFLSIVREVTRGDEFRCTDIITRPELAEVIPCEEGKEDRTIGHRALGRRVLRPVIGRFFKDPDSDEGIRLTVACRFDRSKKAFVYHVVTATEWFAQKAAQKAVTAARAALVRARRAALRRQAAETLARRSELLALVRKSATSAVRNVTPGRKQRARRKENVRPAARGVRVEEGLPKTALNKLNPGTA